ncbi:MAG TPA: hypothetical protein VNP97_14455 [Microbacterium sp.]|nr:hypothetical protein [Microbacterium sp.]
MYAISNGRPQTRSRMSRGLGMAAVTVILVAGLAGCMTGRTASGAVVVERNAVAPAGVDLNQTADRIAEQLAQQAAVNRANSARYAGRLADRLPESLDRGPRGTWSPAAERVAPTNPFPGMPVDRIQRLMRVR